MKTEMTNEQKLALVQKALNGKLEVKWDAMDTAEAGAGAEFIDTGMSSTVLQKVRDAQSVLSKLPTPITMPTGTFEIPTEWADPTFYAGSENTAGPGTEWTASNAGTGSITLTSKKFTAITYLSGELDEDAIVSIRPYVEDKISKAYTELLDKVLINWDTTTAATGNVNSDDAAPTAGTYYLQMDGMRKAAIDNSKTVDAGTLDSTDFRAARKLLGRKWLNPDKLLWILGADVYYKLLGLTQAETIEKFGTAATFSNGTLSAVDGIEIVTNGDVPTTEADGKVSDTPANNTVGTALLVYREDIITGFKRELKTNVEYLPNLDQFRISAHTRFALTIKATDSVAALINVTI